MDCPQCGHRNREGEWLCSGCSALLIDGAGADTALVGAAVVERRPRRSGAKAQCGTGTLHRIVFTIAGQAYPLVLPPQRELVIGRCITPSDVHDVLDLCDLVCDASGVSRMHARLSRSGEAVFLADLHSTNGTFLNGHRLVPDRRHLVTSGDRISFGDLLVRIQID